MVHSCIVLLTSHFHSFDVFKVVKDKKLGSKRASSGCGIASSQYSSGSSIMACMKNGMINSQRR